MVEVFVEFFGALSKTPKQLVQANSDTRHNSQDIRQQERAVSHVSVNGFVERMHERIGAC